MANKKIRSTPTPEEVIAQRIKTLRSREEVKYFFQRLIILAAFVYLVFGVFFGFYVPHDNDMYPRISAGDLLIYYRLSDSYSDQDIVVYTAGDTDYAGRIVARPGDTVELGSDGEFRINGSRIFESGIFYTTAPYDTDVTYPLTLSEDEFFLLCDMREGGRDSRFFGAVKKSSIKGKVITLLRRSSL